MKTRSRRTFDRAHIPNRPGFQMALNLKDGRQVKGIVERYNGLHRLHIDATEIGSDWKRVEFDQVETWQAIEQDPAVRMLIDVGHHHVSVCTMHLPLAEKLSKGESDIREDWAAGDCDICPSKHPCYVSIYLEDRAYGGPEEGGWWYDYGVLQADPRNKCFSSKILAMRYASKLQDELDANENSERRSDTSSMASEGRFMAYIDCDGEFPKNFPDKKPHYE
ncbi:MAG TPA: hypothetical protein EYN91_04375 [Candidatus Melainabacteria bacterium]|jgi:hypothetical protein|nr:hypothetical protein [Candidatus Melainabacteria bacterium]HIN66178.1 hypothetical protein [Candidatus Obscuribacterales bacterium]